MKKAIGKLVLIAILAMTCVATNGCGQEKEQPVTANALGEWVAVKQTAEADGKLHKVKFRVTKVVTDEKKALKEIEKYNSSGAPDMVEIDIENQDLQFCVAHYEVKYGAKFPEKEFGISKASLPIKISNVYGKEEIEYDGSIYQNLTETQEMGPILQGFDFYVPKTYKGKIAYLMPKGCTDYVFDYSYEEDGKPIHHYVSPIKESEE